MPPRKLSIDHLPQRRARHQTPLDAGMAALPSARCAPGRPRSRTGGSGPRSAFAGPALVRFHPLRRNSRLMVDGAPFQGGGNCRRLETQLQLSLDVDPLRQTQLLVTTSPCNIIPN